MRIKEKVKKVEEIIYGWGRWSGLRELSRGLLHACVGIVGWILIHPLQVADELISILLLIVALTFLMLDEIRLAVIRIDLKVVPKWFKWLFWLLKWIEKKLVRASMTRDTEINQHTTIIHSVLGLSVAWIIAPRWIAVFAGFLFSFVDPLAKLGKYWPIKKFKSGRAYGKSLGGCLFGFLGGVIAVVWIICWHLWHIPLFPSSISIIHAVTVYLAGLASAPLFELYSGKQDNIAIPAGSAVLMTLTSYLFSLFG